MSSPSLQSPDLERFYLGAAPSAVAFVDESMRLPSGSGQGSSRLQGSFYQMAAVIFAHARLDAIRERLVDRAGGRYWHTNKKFRGTDGDRGDIVEMIEFVTDASEWSVVAVKLPLAGNSRRALAQARTVCLDRLVRHLTTGTGEDAVRAIVADNNKDPALNKLDHRVLDRLRGSGMISRQVGFTHGLMGDEPLLWSADAISWAVQRNIARDDARFIQPTLDEGKLTMINAVDGESLNMKHPLGASAITRGPSALGPGSSGSREYDVASSSMVSAQFWVDNGQMFAPGQTVSADLLRQIRKLGELTRRRIGHERAV